MKILMLSISGLLAACAQAPETIIAAYVSPVT